MLREKWAVWMVIGCVLGYGLCSWLQAVFMVMGCVHGYGLCSWLRAVLMDTGCARLCLAVRIDTVVVAVDMDTAEEAMLICRKMRCMSYTVVGGLMLSAVTQETLVLCCRSTA